MPSSRSVRGIGEQVRCTCPACVHVHGSQGTLVSLSTRSRHIQHDFKRTASEAASQLIQAADASRSAPVAPGLLAPPSWHHGPSDSASRLQSQLSHLGHIPETTQPDARQMKVSRVPEMGGNDYGNIEEDICNMSADSQDSPSEVLIPAPSEDERPDDHSHTPESDGDEEEEEEEDTDIPIPQAREESNGSDEHPSSDPTSFVPIIDDIKMPLDFIRALQSASLDSKVEPSDDFLIDIVNKPIRQELDLNDPDLRLSIDLFLATSGDPEASYASARTAILRRYPNSQVLTYHGVRQVLAELTNIVPINP